MSLLSFLARRQVALKTYFQQFEKLAFKYWELRDARVEAGFDQGFAEYVMQRTWNDGEDDGMYENAWFDRAQNEEFLDETLDEFLLRQGGYVAVRQSIQAHADSMIDIVVQGIKQTWKIKNPRDLSRLPQGPLVLNVPLKELLWYTRNYIHHHSEGGGSAKNSMLAYKKTISREIAFMEHSDSAVDFERHFRIELNENVSDEVIKIIGWTSYDDLLASMKEYEFPA